MEQFLISPLFTILIFPIMSVIIGVSVKFATQNDRYAKFRKEDIAIGLDLLLAATLMLVVQTTEVAVELTNCHAEIGNAVLSNPIDTAAVSLLQREADSHSNKLVTSGFLIAALFLGLWAVSTIVRKWGWKKANDLKPIIGIAFPLTMGVIALAAIMARVLP